MIDRYTREEIGRVWSEQNRFDTWLKVEIAAVEVWAELGVVPEADLDQIVRRASFDVEEIKQREKTTNHDVAAFIDVVADSVGDAGRWVHYGLTSSDVIDTAMALQLKQASEYVLQGARLLVDVLSARAREFKDTLCIGRTHGVHAEPTTFGLRLAGFAFEAERNFHRLEAGFGQTSFGKLSGAVGTYSTTSPEFESKVLQKLGLKQEPLSTQIIPRDRHAQLMQALALAAASIERFATEIRHLQRTEVREVEEPFKTGQKGSSAMPHKRNPITTEKLTGLARIIRGNSNAALENVALWHERDISHSSVERVILPDSTILVEYMCHQTANVARDMTVHSDRMLDNLDHTSGAIFSQRALTALVEAGFERDEAYRIVQHHAQRAWDNQESFKDLLLADPDVNKSVDIAKLEKLFDYNAYLTNLPEVFERLEHL